MSPETITEFLTSKTGIVASVAVIIALVGGVLKIILPIMKIRKDGMAAIANLSMSGVKVEDPPPWSEAGKADFELVNTQGGKAVMSDLLLVVTESGVSETPKMVEAAAPVPQFSYKVLLEPGPAEHDVRKKEFGTPPPHSYEKGEVESFSIELRSTEPQWYQFRFFVRWYDTSRPGQTHELRSESLRIEFKPEIEDLLN